MPITDTTTNRELRIALFSISSTAADTLRSALGLDSTTWDDIASAEDIASAIAIIAAGELIDEETGEPTAVRTSPWRGDWY